MANVDAKETNQRQTYADFPPTRWTLVMNQENPAALEALCKSYWPPLYSFLRRSGNDPQRAEDLTQGFFAQLLSKDRLQKADRTRGKFRSFLLGCIKNYAQNEWEREVAQKRGGGTTVIPIDTSEAETHLGINPAHHSDPASVFEEQWARTLLARVRANLEGHYAAHGKGKLFSTLVSFLTGDGADYGTVAASLEMNQGAVRTAVHRLRADYRKFLRAEVGRTVGTDAEIDDEIRYLLSVVARG